MRRLMAIAVVLVAFGGAGVGSAQAPAGASRAARCSKVFTVRMARRAVLAVDRGTRRPSRRELRMLGRIERCQRNPAARWYVRWLYSRERSRHAERIRAAQDARLPQAVASWYEDAGGTACGFHAGYGIAHKSLACGTRVLICYPAGSSHCVGTVVDDRGPFVAGRTFDLNQSVAGALGFSGVQTVSYRIG